MREIFISKYIVGIRILCFNILLIINTQKVNLMYIHCCSCIQWIFPIWNNSSNGFQKRLNHKIFYVINIFAFIYNIVSLKNLYTDIFESKLFIFVITFSLVFRVGLMSENSIHRNEIVFFHRALHDFFYSEYL